jgi:hypothetical protein
MSQDSYIEKEDLAKRHGDHRGLVSSLNVHHSPLHTHCASVEKDLVFI